MRTRRSVEKQLLWYPAHRFSEPILELSVRFVEIHLAAFVSPVEALKLKGHNTMNNEEVSNILRTSVKLSWNHGGKQVAIIGSWDNWETREILQSIGKEFFIIKMLPTGVYHYRFMVDGWLTYAPDLPWVCDDSGNSYNILDLMTPISELPESLSEFEFPPSPPSSYDNQYFNDDDFSRPPPDLPPQLRETILNESSCFISGQQSGVQPRHTELNHLYQNNVGVRDLLDQKRFWIKSAPRICKLYFFYLCNMFQAIGIEMLNPLNCSRMFLLFPGSHIHTPYRNGVLHPFSKFLSF